MKDPVQKYRFLNWKLEITNNYLYIAVLIKYAGDDIFTI